MLGGASGCLKSATTISVEILWAAASWAARASSRSWRRAVKIRFVPPAASSRASAVPIPALAPVTSAHFPRQVSIGFVFKPPPAEPPEVRRLRRPRVRSPTNLYFRFLAPRRSQIDRATHLRLASGRGTLRRPQAPALHLSIPAAMQSPPARAFLPRSARRRSYTQER